MLLTDNHFTVVLGIDIHFTTLPPFNPFHPYIGLVLDPMDYIPFIGGTVNVNGIKRGVSDTSGIIVTLVHIPLFTPPWVMTPIIGHESTNFFASTNVFADGSRLSPKGYMVMTCNDIGIPLSLQPGKKKFWKLVPTLFAPTSYSLPIPTGPPVNVGGPYVPDWGGMLKNLAMSFGFGAIMKFGKKIFNRLLRNAVGPNWLSRALCHSGFEPVNFINGAVVYDGTDFTLPGPIPFDWKRSWYSDSKYKGLLGHGCHWEYDRELKYYLEDEAYGLRMSDGRVVAFPNIEIGESFYLRQEKITLKRHYNRFEAYHHEENLTYHFSSQANDFYKLTKIEREGGSAIRFNYYGKRLESILDSAGRTIIIKSDGENRVVSATVTIGSLEEKKISYQYDAEGNMIAITDAVEQSTIIAYDNHQMVKKTDRNGQSFYWEYDSKGRCIHTWGDGGLQEGWLEYFPEKGYNKITDANKATTTYYYDDNQLVNRVENPLGASKLFQYTEFMELYREIDEDGNMTGYTYNDNGYVTGIHYPDGTARQYMYDDKDRLLINLSPGGNQEVYTYYEDTQLVRAVIHPDRSVTKYTYNKEGLPETIQKGDNKLQMFYDQFYNLIELHGNGQISRWNYNLLGDVIKIEDATGGIQRYDYDELGRVRSITQNDGTRQQLYYNAYDEVTEIDRNGEMVASFAYTPMGSLVKRKQGNTQVSFGYDRMERLTRVINEHSETYNFTRNAAGDIIAETGFDDITKHYLRSDAGKVLGIKGPGGMNTKYRYNGKGQITYAEYSDQSWESYSYDKDGLLISAENEHGKIIQERNINGQITSETQSRGIADQGNTISSTYDEEGRRLNIRSTLGAAISQEYNALGQLKNVTSQGWEAHIERNARGQATEYSFSGGVQSSFAYDGSGRPIAQTVKNGLGRESYKRSYHWNSANQLLQSVNQLKGNHISYDYDALAQLVSATGKGMESEFKCPDAVGNLYETPDRTDKTYSSGGKLERDKNWFYYYDTLGNLKLKSAFALHGKEPDKSWQTGCWHYDWFANGMLKSVKKPNGHLVSFEYDALGRRTAKIADNKITRYLWDGNVLLQEWGYDVADRPKLMLGDLGELFYDKEEPIDQVITWVYEEGSFVPIAKLIDGEKFSIISDYLGTPIQSYNENGELIWERELNIYGGVRKETGLPNFVAMRYQGQYYDEEIELCYNRFRYYDPKSGNYLSKDPIGLKGNNPNLYSYVADINSKIDRLGLTGEPLSDYIIKLAEQHITDTGETVLGHFPEYIEKAKKRGASYFDIGDVWNDLTPDERWGANQYFIDKITDRGDKIILSHSKGNIRNPSYLKDEIEMLISEKGYKWKNQWSLQKMCK